VQAEARQCYTLISNVQCPFLNFSLAFTTTFSTRSYTQLAKEAPKQRSIPERWNSLSETSSKTAKPLAYAISTTMNPIPTTTHKIVNFSSMWLRVTPPLMLTTAGVVEALEVAADTDAVREAKAEPGHVVDGHAEVTAATVEVVPTGVEADVEDA
jgi:hypothetical protein